MEIKMTTSDVNEQSLIEANGLQEIANSEVNDGTNVRNSDQMRLVQSKSEHIQLSTKTGIGNVTKPKSSSGRMMENAHLSNPNIVALKDGSRTHARRFLTSRLPNGLHVAAATRLYKAKRIPGSNVPIANLLYRGDNILDLSRVSKTSIQEKITTQNELDEPKDTYLQFLFNPSLIRDLFILGCGYYAYYTPIVTFPAYGDELGIDKFEIAWTVGLIGMIEVPSRICLSWMTDRFKLRPSSVLTILLCNGVCGQSLVLSPSHMTMIAYACVHGVLGGLSVVVMSSVMAECVGTKQLGSAMGLAVMQMNLAVSLSSTTAGAMKQLTGSYGSVFRVGSAIYLVGALVYCLTPGGFFKNPYKICTPADRDNTHI